jgi:hypothetical protein
MSIVGISTTGGAPPPAAKAEVAASIAQSAIPASRRLFIVIPLKTRAGGLETHPDGSLSAPQLQLFCFPRDTAKSLRQPRLFLGGPPETGPHPEWSFRRDMDRVGLRGFNATRDLATRR